jgi:hypothetical protein
VVLTGIYIFICREEFSGFACNKKDEEEGTS